MAHLTFGIIFFISLQLFMECLSKHATGGSLKERHKRQVSRPTLQEAISEAEGRLLDPALLSMVFTASGVMPNVGSSTMSNAFSSLCSYPYLYYYYQFCMGSSGSNGLSGMFPYTPNSAPSFASPSSAFPMYSPPGPGPNSIEPGPGSFGPGGPPSYGSPSSFPNHFGNPSYNGHFMNPYAWPNSAPSETAPSLPVYSPSESPASSAPSAGTGTGSPGPGGPPPSSSAPNPGSSPPFGQSSPTSFASPRSTFRGSPLTQSEPSAQGPIRTSPMLAERPQSAPIPSVTSRYLPYLEIQPDYRGGFPLSVLPVQSPPNTTTSSGSSTLITLAKGNMIPTVLQEKNTGGVKFPIILPENIVPEEIVPDIGKQNGSTISKNSSRNHLGESNLQLVDLNLMLLTEKRKPGRALSKTISKGGTNRTAQRIKEFEKYLSFAFELVSEEKSGIMNNIINGLKKDGVGRMAVKPEFQSLFNLFMRAFVNGTEKSHRDCLAFYFCTAVTSMSKDSAAFGMEVLQTVSPLASRLLDERSPSGLYALSGISEGIRMGSKIINSNSTEISCPLPREC